MLDIPVWRINSIVQININFGTSLFGLESTLYWFIERLTGVAVGYQIKILEGGRNAPECVAGCIRNQWLGSIGTGGRAGRNMHKSQPQTSLI